MTDAPPPLPDNSPAPPPPSPPSPTLKRNWLLAWIGACVVMPALAGGLAGTNTDAGGGLALILVSLGLILWLISTVMLGRHVSALLAVFMALGGLGLIFICFFVSCLATTGPLNFH